MEASMEAWVGNNPSGVWTGAAGSNLLCVQDSSLRVGIWYCVVS